MAKEVGLFLVKTVNNLRVDNLRVEKLSYFCLRPKIELELS